MCDYSLMAVPNRLAVEGEDLIAHRFPTGSMGLACPAEVKRACKPAKYQHRGIWAKLKAFISPPVWEPVAAVCIPPGARLWLGDIPDHLQRVLKIGSAEEVTFTQIGAVVNSYRDAVEFSNGRLVRLQELREGQRVKVLDLSMAEAFDPAVEEFGWTVRQ